MLWGLTASLDLVNELRKIKKIGPGSEKELNFLLIGASDPRHILKTIAKVYKYKLKLKINFFVIELLLELIARQMLLILVALEPHAKLGKLEKVRLWMELYGNSILRSCTSDYLSRKSVDLIHMISDSNYLNRRINCLKIDELQYKERDMLEFIFMFWSRMSDIKFNIDMIWDDKLRKDLATRYDYRQGVFDWDYNMKIKDLSPVINSREYIYWRHTGVAFTWLETEFSVPNSTFAFGIHNEGDKIVSFGYYGDMLHGPYFSFGTECDDDEMFKKANNIYRKRATDITERNLFRIFHEIENKTEYKPEIKKERDLGLIVYEIGKINMSNEKANIDIKKKEDYSSINIPHTINFLSTRALRGNPKLAGYKDYYDVIYIGQNLVNGFDSDIINCLAANNSLIIIETKKNCIGINKEKIAEHRVLIEKLAEACQCEKLENFDYERNDYAMYKVKIKINK